MLIHSDQIIGEEFDSEVGRVRSIEFSPYTNSVGKVGPLVSVKVLSVSNPGRKNSLTLSVKISPISIHQVCNDLPDADQAVADMTFQLGMIENQFKQARKFLQESSMLEFGLPAPGEFCESQEDIGE